MRGQAKLQLRQKVDHKRTFFYVEQVILKHGLYETMSKIKDEVCLSACHRIRVSVFLLVTKCHLVLIIVHAGGRVGYVFPLSIRRPEVFGFFHGRGPTSLQA